MTVNAVQNIVFEFFLLFYCIIDAGYRNKCHLAWSASNNGSNPQKKEI